MDLEYSRIPERALHVLEGFPTAFRQDIEDDVDRFRHVPPRSADSDGKLEVLHGVEMTHHFMQATGESECETITWHYVEAGKGEPVVLLHGIPDSWNLWNHQIAALSKTHRAIAGDLKGYGQSEKRPGDFRHEGVAEQLLALLDTIDIDSFGMVTHDRGTVQGDWLAAKHPDRMLRYCRGEQHLYHFNRALAPQENLFKGDGTEIARDPVRLVVLGYRWLCARPVPDQDIKRTIQEYSYPEVAQAVMRYFNSSTFHKEWIDRRTNLLNAWTCPILILQGFHSRTQPREWYENARQYIPNARDVRVRYIDAGHFWPLENPQETTQALRYFLNS
jgi:pimeloyl-ACP methyl ester carboxylesterase